jgi:hypothetical protein
MFESSPKQRQIEAIVHPEPTMKLEQKHLLSPVTAQVFVAIAVSEEPDDPSPAAAPTIIETRTSARPTVDLRGCRFAIILANTRNRDTFLSPFEYVRFVNVLSDNQ